MSDPRATRVRIDWPSCVARGLCAEVLPAMITLDEWGYPVVAPGDVPTALLADARAAAEACPKLALRLVKSRG